MDTTENRFLPSQIASGLFMHSLVVMRLIPLKEIRPYTIDPITWTKIFHGSQPENTQATLPCLLTNDCISMLIKHIQETTASSLTTLIENSFNIAVFMSEAFPALRTWNTEKAKSHTQNTSSEYSTCKLLSFLNKTYL